MTDRNVIHELEMERIKNHQNMIHCHREEINKTFAFFVKAITLIIGAAMGLLTQTQIDPSLGGIMIKAAWFLIVVAGVYSFVRIYQHSRRAYRHRREERNLIIYVVQLEDHPAIPPLPERFPGVNMFMVAIIGLILGVVSSGALRLLSHFPCKGEL